MKLGKKYGVAIICKFSTIAISFLITVFINRGLGVAGKGEYAYVTKFVEILYILFSLGLGQAYSTFKRRFGDKVQSVFVSLAFLQCAAVLLLGIPLALIGKYEYGAAIVLLSSIATMNMVISMMAVIEDSVKRNITLTLVNAAYLLVLFLLYITNKLTLSAAFICFGLNEIAAIVCFFALYGFRLSIRETKSCIRSGQIRDIYSTGFITTIVMLLISINYSVDTIMLRRMTDSYHTGIYSVAASLTNMFLLIPDAFKEVLFGDATKKNFAKKTAFSSIKVSLAALGMVLIAFALFGKFAIKLFYGADYLPSYGITLILVIGSVSLVFFKILQPVYIAFGKQKKAAVFLACSAVVNVAANVILIPAWKSVGAAFASAVSYTLCGLFFLVDYVRSREI